MKSARLAPRPRSITPFSTGSFGRWHKLSSPALQARLATRIVHKFVGGRLLGLIKVPILLVAIENGPLTILILILLPINAIIVMCLSVCTYSILRIVIIAIVLTLIASISITLIGVIISVHSSMLKLFQLPLLHHVFVVCTLTSILLSIIHLVLTLFLQIHLKLVPCGNEPTQLSFLVLLIHLITTLLISL